MSAARVVLGGLGVAVAAYGAWLLLTRQDSAAVVEVAVWFAVGAVLHDVLLAPVAGLLGLALPRVLPGAARGPVAAGGVVLVTVLLAAVPVLGRFGALPDNPTLLDRPYAAGAAAIAGVVLAAVVAGVLVRVRSSDGARARRPR